MTGSILLKLKPISSTALCIALMSTALLGSGCDKHELVCEKIAEAAGTHDGFAVPGVAGAPRWGIPETTPETLRERRSWSSLSNDDKQQVMDGFKALKNITVDSGDPGSARADYTSFCTELGQHQY